MGRKMNWDRCRFSGVESDSLAVSNYRDVGAPFFRGSRKRRTFRPATAAEKLKRTQTLSLRDRAKKGRGQPSMPTFSWDKEPTL